MESFYFDRPVIEAKIDVEPAPVNQDTSLVELPRPFESVDDDLQQHDEDAFHELPQALSPQQSRKPPREMADQGKKEIGGIEEQKNDTPLRTDSARSRTRGSRSRGRAAVSTPLSTTDAVSRVGSALSRSSSRGDENSLRGDTNYRGMMANLLNLVDLKVYPISFLSRLLTCAL